MVHDVLSLSVLTWPTFMSLVVLITCSMGHGIFPDFCSCVCLHLSLSCMEPNVGPHRECSPGLGTFPCCVLSVLQSVLDEQVRGHRVCHPHSYQCMVSLEMNQHPNASERVGIGCALFGKPSKSLLKFLVSAFFVVFISPTHQKQMSAGGLTQEAFCHFPQRIC